MEAERKDGQNFQTFNLIFKFWYFWAQFVKVSFKTVNFEVYFILFRFLSFQENIKFWTLNFVFKNCLVKNFFQNRCFDISHHNSFKFDDLKVQNLKMKVQNFIISISKSQNKKL